MALDQIIENKYIEDLEKVQESVKTLSEFLSDCNKQIKKHLTVESPLLDQVALLSIRSMDAPDFLDFTNELLQQVNEIEELLKNEETKCNSRFNELYESAEKNIQCLNTKLNSDKQLHQDSSERLLFFEKEIDTASIDIAGLKSEYTCLMKHSCMHAFYDISEAKKNICDTKKKFEDQRSKFSQTILCAMETENNDNKKEGTPLNPIYAHLE